MTLQDLTAAFAHEYAQRPIPTQGPIDTSPIDTTPDTDEFDAIWQQVIPETRARDNDFHLPFSVAYARRLCDAYPQADGNSCSLSPCCMTPAGPTWMKTASSLKVSR